MCDGLVITDPDDLDDADLSVDSQTETAINLVVERQEQKFLMPHSIKVGPHTVTIRPARDGEDQGGELRAWYTAYDLEIVYDAEHPTPGKLRDSILHEVQHAINSTAGLTVFYEDGVEEDWVLRTTPYWLQVMRENPELVQFIMQGVEW